MSGRGCGARAMAWVTSFDGALAAAGGAAAELERLMVCVGLTHHMTALTLGNSAC
eukprot:COSAG01_NODE_939_length_12606_cov_97.306308_7_plen_55_part_00